MIWFLVAQGIVFLLWAIEAFRTLFGLRKRAAATTGRQFPGPLSFVGAVSTWLRDPAERSRRWRLLGLTVVLLALTLIWSQSHSGVAGP